MARCHDNDSVDIPRSLTESGKTMPASAMQASVNVSLGIIIIWYLYRTTSAEIGGYEEYAEASGV